MRSMHDFLATIPFDLYELHLFRLVVSHGSFTKAAQIAGLTQSAITRQVQGMETNLGFPLLERTTRKVKTTPAGDFLFRQSARLIGDVDDSLRRLREEFGGAKKEVRVGISRSISLSYLPGFFHANLRHYPEVGCHMSHLRSVDIIAALEANELELGVLCPPKRLPNTLKVTHRFNDIFTLIAPRDSATEFQSLPKSGKARSTWLARQPWLLLDEESNTGKRLQTWMRQQDLRIEPSMRLDSFDLIINLVALGMGVSFVPIRALAMYGRKQTLQRISLKERFSRELVVVIRRNRSTPEHLKRFVANVLF